MWFLSLIPAVLKVVDLVEGLVAGSGQGEVKKSLVMGAAQTIMEAGSALTGQGNSSQWKDMEKPVSSVIDAVVSVANATGCTAIKDDTK